LYRIAVPRDSLTFSLVLAWLSFLQFRPLPGADIFSGVVRVLNLLAPDLQDDEIANITLLQNQTLNMKLLFRQLP
jgi:hypothetical protein